MAEEIAAKLKLQGWFKMNTRDLAEPTLSPQKLDWQIIQSLRYNACCPIKEIAEANSITPRMAEYRITKLLDSKILFIRAVINAQKQQGILFYNLALVTDAPKQSPLIDKLKEKHSDRIWIVLTPDPTVILVGFFGMTPGEPEDTMMKVRELEGVQDCFLSIFKEFIEPKRPNWVDGLIERAIAQQPATVLTETELRN
jgi:DNA-binding Lrp family transcriptional regulator